MSLKTNPLLVGGVLVMIGLQMLYTYLPGMNRLLGTDPIAPYTWLYILGVAVAVHVVMEIEKWIRRRWERRHAVTEVCQ